MRKYFCFLIGVLPFAFLIFSLFGCAQIKEGTKGFLGVSTDILEKGRVNAIKKEFDLDYNSCIAKSKQVLKNGEAYIYAEDLKKNMIALYVSEADTTPVGLFFKQIDATHTQIEVTSPSSYAKEFIAEMLVKGLSTQEKQGEANARKDLGNK